MLREARHPLRSSAALVIAILGAWAALVPFLGPYFGFGFDTEDPWVLSQEHWTLSLAPGTAVVAGGLALLLVTGRRGGLAALAALAGGAWLVVGPSLYPLWSGGELEPVAGSDWKTALLWIGYFYGVGALVLWLTGLVQGLVPRRPVVVEERAMIVEPPRERAPRRDRLTVYP